MRVCSKLKIDDRVVIPRAWVAQRFFSRFLGLMGRHSIQGDEAIVFPRCNSIHTFFMRFPIDVILVGVDGVVVDVIEAMPSFRCLWPRRRAHHVIEMGAQRSKTLGIRVGVKLRCEGAWQ